MENENTLSALKNIVFYMIISLSFLIYSSIGEELKYIIINIFFFFGISHYVFEKILSNAYSEDYKSIIHKEHFKDEVSDIIFSRFKHIKPFFKKSSLDNINRILLIILNIIPLLAGFIFVKNTDITLKISEIIIHLTNILSLLFIVGYTYYKYIIYISSIIFKPFTYEDKIVISEKDNLVFYENALDVSLFFKHNKLHSKNFPSIIYGSFDIYFKGIIKQEYECYIEGKKINIPQLLTIKDIHKILSIKSKIKNI
jgi:hypothetical protein